MTHASALQSRAPRISLFRRAIWALTALSSLALAAPSALVLASPAQAQEEAEAVPMPDLAALSPQIREAAGQAREAEAQALEAADTARNAALNGRRARGHTVTNGNGLAEFRGGASYAGNFTNGAIDGFGVYEFGEGSTIKYEGEFSDGQVSGFGVYYWRSGGRYAGHRVEGAREGSGVYFFPDGTRFEGAWSGDARNGPGVEWSADGRLRSAGLWRNDAYVGRIPNSEASSEASSAGTGASE
jgi:hypothetical protein